MSLSPPRAPFLLAGSVVAAFGISKIPPEVRPLTPSQAEQFEGLLQLGELHVGVLASLTPAMEFPSGSTLTPEDILQAARDSLQALRDAKIQDAIRTLPSSFLMQHEGHLARSRPSLPGEPWKLVLAAHDERSFEPHPLLISALFHEGKHLLDREMHAWDAWEAIREASKIDDNGETARRVALRHNDVFSVVGDTIDFAGSLLETTQYLLENEIVLDPRGGPALSMVIDQVWEKSESTCVLYGLEKEELRAPLLEAQEAWRAFQELHEDHREAQKEEEHPHKDTPDLLAEAPHGHH